MYNETFSLTFGDQGENHVGMEKIGEIVEKGYGFNLEDFLNYEKLFKNDNINYKIYNLNELYNSNIYKLETPNAYLMVIKNGIDYFLKDTNISSNDLYNQLTSIPWDTKYYDVRRKKVLNKNARHNICFGTTNSEPDYINKKGRIISYNNIIPLKLLTILMMKTKN